MASIARAPTSGRYPHNLAHTAPSRRAHNAGRSCPPPLSPDLILATVATAWGITAAELVGPSRSPRLVQARQVVVHLARVLLGASWSEAAAAVGRADHTTAMNADARLRSALDHDEALTARLAWVTAALSPASAATERHSGAPTAPASPMARQGLS